MPRAVSAAAMLASDAALSARMLSITGARSAASARTLAALATAATRPAASACARVPGCRFGLPSRTPRALAAARAALVRAEIIRASSSATAARMWMVSRLTVGGRDELDAGFHEVRHEGDVTGKPVQFGDQQDGATGAAGCQRRGELRAIVLSAALDLDRLGHNRAAGGRCMRRYCRTLRLEAEAALALLVGGNPKVADEGGHNISFKRPFDGNVMHFTPLHVNTHTRINMQLRSYIGLASS
jgi:hypothetical protein